MAVVSRELMNLLGKLETEQQETEKKISDIQNNLLPSAENKLDIVKNEIESAREYVQSRLGSITSKIELPQIGSVIPTGSLKELQDDAFRLFNEGDKAIKEAAKIKINLPPQVSDIATQLAGGLDIKNFMSSLSSFSIPGLEELDSLKKMASDAQNSLNGKLSSIKGSLGDLGALSAVQSFQDLGKLKDMAKGITDKAGSFLNEANKLKDVANNAINEAKGAYEKAKQEVETSVNKIKDEARQLENQANSLYEQAKNTPANLQDSILTQANQISDMAKSKFDEAKKTGENLVKDAQRQFEAASAEAKKSLDKVKELEQQPEVLQAKALAAEIAEKEKEVNKIKESIPPDIVSAIDSAVKDKVQLENTAAKASIIQETALKSAADKSPNVDVSTHVSKEFKPFSEWVLETNNIVFTEPNYEPPNTDPSDGKLEENPNLVPSIYASNKAPEPVLDTSFVIYRGATGNITNPTRKEMEINAFKEFGIQRFPTRFKSFCDFGVNKDSVVDINKLFSGYIDKIMSPIDIAIILNAGNVGMFNNVVPYGFGVGSELAAPITFQNTKLGKKLGEAFDKGGVGTKRGDNWAFQPHWAGLYINFLLDTNGIYQSDQDFIDLTYIKHMDTLISEGKAYGIKLDNTSPISDIPKAFPGAVIGYYDKATSQGHAEILLRVSLNGFLTLGGNIKIQGASKIGTSHGFRFYTSLREFSPNNEVMILRRGMKTGWTVNGRLDGRIKRTPVIDEYMDAIEDKEHPKHSKLLVGGYNLLRDHLTSVVYTREEQTNINGLVSMLDNGKIGILDESFRLHTNANNYINNKPPTPFTVFSSDEIRERSKEEGH